MSSLLNVWIICIYLANFTAGYENLAIQKPAWQSSNYSKNKWFAENAVDGKKSQRATDGSCALAEGRKSNTWGVDLGRQLSINDIQIYYRYESKTYWDEIFKGRCAGFSLYISNTTNKSEGHLCYKDTNNTKSVTNIDCTIFGRYVIFYNERKNGTSYPSYYSSHILNELCEVEVFGCGYYGNGCIAPCPQNCKDQKCDVINGTCDNCIDGYQGQFCNRECDVNFYGAACGMQCGNCINANNCNHIDGTCPNGCAPGWRENTCKTKCNLGTFGPGCNNNCNVNCERNDASVCDHVTGSCTSDCIDGWKGSHCNEVCNVNFYGPSCSMQCGNCINADNCNHVNGSCPNGCATGWKEYTCKTKCEHGTYGPGCNNSCSINCLENDMSVCDHVTGSCTSGCTDGWKGTHCNTVCEDYFFGQKCQQKCGNCFDGVTCHHVNGDCIDGCAAGRKGPKCVEECEETYYGENCKLKCSSYCVNRTCDAITGDCILLFTQGKEVNHDSSNAVVAGGVVGGVIAFCALLAVVVVLFIRCKRRTENQYEDTLHCNVLDNEKTYTTMEATSSPLNIYEDIAKSSTDDSDDQKVTKKTPEPLYKNNL